MPGARRVPIAEVLARINLQLWTGNFELDFSDGELRFRIGIDVEDGTMSRTMLSDMLGCALQQMERFHVALMKIAFGEVESIVAHANVE